MQHPCRILSRRYPLTKTGYKYLDVGINIATPSHVEIALIDNRGMEIQFAYNVWKAFLDQRDIIHRYFNNDDESEVYTTKKIGHITLSFGKLNNVLKVLRLETPTVYLIMTRNTVYNMIAHEYCVDCIVQSLGDMTNIVDTKLARFREIVNGASDPAAIHVALSESESFDKNDIVDCELLAQIFAMR